MKESTYEISMKTLDNILVDIFESRVLKLRWTDDNTNKLVIDLTGLEKFFINTIRNDHLEINYQDSSANQISMIVPSKEVPQFYEKMLFWAQKTFISYEVSFPDDYLKVKKIVYSLLNEQPLDKEFKAVLSNSTLKSQKYLRFYIKDRILKKTHQIDIFNPDNDYLGGYHVRASFYPYLDAISTSVAHFIINPNQLPPMILKHLDKLELNKENNQFISNHENFIEKLKPSMGSLILKNTLENSLSANENKNKKIKI